LQLSYSCVMTLMWWWIALAPQGLVCIRLMPAQSWKARS
jgi:hypothetical protein